MLRRSPNNSPKTSPKRLRLEEDVNKCSNDRDPLSLAPFNENENDLIRIPVYDANGRHYLTHCFNKDDFQTYVNSLRGPIIVNPLNKEPISHDLLRRFGININHIEVPREQPPEPDWNVRQARQMARELAREADRRRSPQRAAREDVTFLNILNGRYGENMARAMQEDHQERREAAMLRGSPDLRERRRSRSPRRRSRSPRRRSPIQFDFISKLPKNINKILKRKSPTRKSPTRLSLLHKRSTRM